MAEIIKVYEQEVPPLLFIGKKYGDSDRVNGVFGAKWGEWFENGWFEAIEKQCNANTQDTCDDGDAYIGLMRQNGDEFEYLIGMFVPSGTAIPEGFDSIEFPAATLGVCWVYGNEENGEIYMHETKCSDRLTEDGHPPQNDTRDGCLWCFERYACPRFTTPDEKGNVILDICFFTTFA